MHSPVATTTVNGVYCEATERLQEADGQITAIDRNARVRSALPKWRLKRVIEYVNMNLAERITLADMAGAAGLSRMHFAAQFRIATGLRPHDFLLRCRIEMAQELLAGTNQRIIDIAMAAGFQTQAHFTTVFKRIAGDTPRQWRLTAARRFKAQKVQQAPRRELVARSPISIVAAGWQGNARAAEARPAIGF
ncbi:helix-turn-helix domain-containing protein [Ancylobacter vacuolatus]|uniref:AraC-like DNA-binding protein n=1 Tax=Ancylobacter vacuolatus TaxID=223389 RepID=A0ABU0DK35_9HYPH|nr:AraC family transcriptional regulator [Ancylobacter vacuolatus]MDQ0348795.1 AraC-like DNA-binding protein [Ancylobacter vacuolatus]